jgi:DNA-binding transcriptional LysR family regulator
VSDRWIGLDLRHLVTFQAIAEEGSFKAAARALGYTPSAVSQQIAGLERVVGVQLIAREQGRHALGLTDAGTILLLHVAAIEAHLGAAKADIEALAEGAAGTLRVGAYESVSARLLPELIGRLQEGFPQTRVEVQEALTDLDHLASLERGSLDLAFTLLPLPQGPFRARAVLRDPWVLVAQAGSPVAAMPPASLDLAFVGQLPLVCFRAPRSIDEALDQFRAAGIEPNIVLRSDYNDAVQEFAAAGRGVALMPRLAVNRRDARTAIVELGELIPPREIALAWHGDRSWSDVLEVFVSLAAELGSRLGEPMSDPRAGPRAPDGTRRPPELELSRESDALRAPAVSDHGESLPRAGAAGPAGGA